MTLEKALETREKYADKIHDTHGSLVIDHIVVVPSRQEDFLRATAEMRSYDCDNFIYEVKNCTSYSVVALLSDEHYHSSGKNMYVKVSSLK
jgi:hypothetical protein